MEYEKCFDKVLYIDGQGNKAVENFFIAIGVFIAFCGFVFSNWSAIGPYRVLAYFLLDIGMYILNFLLIYALHLMVLCVREGGYVKYLEEKINKLIKDKVLCWESSIAQKLVHKGNTSLFVFILVGMLFFLVSIGAVYICFAKILFTRYWYLGIIVLILFLAEIIGTIVMFIELKKAHYVSYSIGINYGKD